MAESTIGWLHPPPGLGPAPAGTPGMPGYTVNFWNGCAKADAGCTNCYAERRAERHLLQIFRDAAAAGQPVWGPNAPRHIKTGRALHALHRDIARWNREAEAAGERRLVFGGSQMDWLEDRRDLDAPRRELIAAIEASPWLQWIQLTKRPENFARLVPEWAVKGCPANVWFGISASNQQTLDDKLEAFRAVPARFKVISGEPLIGMVDWREALKIPGLVWLILGGESGGRDKVRGCIVDAIAAGVDQARDRGVACFVKQLGAVVFGAPDCLACADKPHRARCTACGDRVERVLVARTGRLCPEADRDLAEGATYRRLLHLVHPKGEDPLEWPRRVQVQEFPTGARFVYREAG